MATGSARSGGVGEDAYVRIRADIIAGHLVPGERLKLDRLRERYGVSVSTLRETLSRLSAERLVLAEGQRGFQVASVSVAEFRQIAALRLLLEQQALADSFRTGDLDWEAQVVAAHHRLDAVEQTLAPGAAGPELGKRYDFAFHHALVSACGSPVLLDAFTDAYDRFLRYLMVALAFRGEIARGEHRVLMECALRRDLDTARQTLAWHIEGAVDSAAESPLLR